MEDIKKYNIDMSEKRKKTDDETIDLLLKHGADLEKEHEIDFIFTGNQSGLNKVENILINQNFVKLDSNKENELIMRQNIKLDLMNDHMITESLENIACQNGVVFEGWGTVALK